MDERETGCKACHQVLFKNKWPVPSVERSLVAIFIDDRLAAWRTQAGRPGRSMPRTRGWGVWLIAWLAVCTAVPALALQITDDRGVTVTLAAPPQRIVSLLPSLTETMCELGQCQRLVGVDRYSNWPASIAALPRLGGGLDPSIEAVVALKPDLVLLATSTRAAQRLEALGLKVVALEPRSLADVRRVLAQVAQLLGLPDADGQRAWLRIETALGAIAQSIPPRSRGASVYFEVSRGPFAASEASFIGEMLVKLGSRSIVPATMGPFPKLNPEFVVRADPDLIMIGDENFAGLGARPGWAQMRAVREQRVCVFPPAQADILVRAGPRLVEAARLMAGCLATHAPRLPTVKPAGMP
jgi:iron complex transport system substrate-binding protein